MADDEQISYQRDGAYTFNQRSIKTNSVVGGSNSNQKTNSSRSPTNLSKHHAMAQSNTSYQRYQPANNALIKRGLQK